MFAGIDLDGPAIACLIGAFICFPAVFVLIGALIGCWKATTSARFTGSLILGLVCGIPATLMLGVGLVVLGAFPLVVVTPLVGAVLGFLVARAVASPADQPP